MAKKLAHGIFNMEKKQTLKERMEEIQDNFGKLNGFENYRQYREAGNNLARYELQDLMQQAYNLDRESPPITGTAEEASFLYASNKLAPNESRNAFIAGAQWQASIQSTTIERLQSLEMLTKALEAAKHELEQFIPVTDVKVLEQINEALASTKCTKQ